MTISGFVAYVKQAWKNKPDTSTPLSAARLTHLEDGIKGNSDAIEKIAAAVVSQIVNDPNKIASMAALYNVNQAVTQLNSDIGDSVKKKQSHSTNPDTIKWTDVRSLNGWDGSIQPHIPVKLRNQWLSCVTTSPYDGVNSEALCQILISADKAVHASRRMDNNGNWLPWQVNDFANIMHIIETGFHQFQNVPAKGFAEYDVLYTKTYTTAPYVIAFGSSNGCRLVVTAANRTGSGHRLQVYNPSEGVVTADIRWITFM